MDRKQAINFLAKEFIDHCQQPHDGKLSNDDILGMLEDCWWEEWFNQVGVEITSAVETLVDAPDAQGIRPSDLELSDTVPLTEQDLDEIKRQSDEFCEHYRNKQ